LARKRAREELPSEDELPSSSGGNGTTTDGAGKRIRENSGKKKRVRRREGRDGRERGVMEEEIVVPRITQHSTVPPLISFYSHSCLFFFISQSPIRNPPDIFPSHFISSPLHRCFPFS